MKVFFKDPHKPGLNSLFMPKSNYGPFFDNPKNVREPKNGIVKIFSHSQVIMQGKVFALCVHIETSSPSAVFV